MGNITDESIKEGIKEIIAKELRINPEEILDDSHIVNDVGVESADMISILYDIEDRFNVEISDEEAGENLTIPQMVNLLKGKINN